MMTNKQILFPHSFYGDDNGKRPILLLLSSFPKSPLQCYSKIFLDLLATDYFLILLSFPPMPSYTSTSSSSSSRENDANNPLLLVQEENRYGYSFIQLIQMFYQTLLHFQLISASELNDPVIQETFRQMSSIEEQLLHPITVTNDEVKDEVEISVSDTLSTDEFTVQESHHFYPREETKYNDNHHNDSNDGLIHDDEDLRHPSALQHPTTEGDEIPFLDEEYVDTPQFLSPLKPSLPMPINIFNVQEIQQENERLQQQLSKPDLLSFHSSAEEVALPILTKIMESRQSFIEDQSKRQLSTRIKGILGQDYFANYFIFIYQNHFPNHFQSIILFNYGLKRVFFISEILFMFSWEWLTSFFFYFHWASSTMRMKTMVTRVWKWYSFILILIVGMASFILQIHFLWRRYHSMVTIVTFIASFWYRKLIGGDDDAEYVEDSPEYYRCMRVMKNSHNDENEDEDEVKEDDKYHEFMEILKLNRWKEEIRSYQVDMFYPYYQLWNGRNRGVNLEARFPTTCPILFMVSPSSSSSFSLSIYDPLITCSMKVEKISSIILIMNSCMQLMLDSIVLVMNTGMRSRNDYKRTGSLLSSTSSGDHQAYRSVIHSNYLIKSINSFNPRS